jgi:hypothetical protein
MVPVRDNMLIGGCAAPDCGRDKKQADVLGAGRPSSYKIK